jgi:MOSC domain-containing protein YiiM
MLRETNLDGDRQADLSVHGGVNKAVYTYPSEYYSYWRQQLPKEELPWGAFGENFTAEGLLESGVCMGDQYRVGSAVVRVTTPRLPCFKLAAKFQREDMIKRFLSSGYSGFYFSVVEEGEVAAGDEFQFLTSEIPSLIIAEFNHLYTSPRLNSSCSNALWKSKVCLKAGASAFMRAWKWPAKSTGFERMRRLR